MFLPKGLTLSMMQTKWASILDPLLANPLNGISILKNITLASGINVINHKLQQPLQGWFIVRRRAACNLYDTQDSNQTPQLTLQLVSDAAASVDIGVF